MMTEQLYDFDSIGHASLSTIGTLESLHPSFNSSSLTINSLDALNNNSIVSIGYDKKTVRWAPSTSKRECISRYQMTFEEAQRTWILRDEKSSMMQRHIADVKREKEGLPEEESVTFRGLDALHDERAGKINRVISSCVQAVLQAQKKLKGSDLVDPTTQLALASARFSGGSRQMALNRAERDFQEAKIVYFQTGQESSIDKKESHASPNVENKRSLVNAQKTPSHSFTRGPTTNHLEKYSSSQQTRVIMRGGLV
mmetsp:Transcript_14283/g.34673  ORF Transcript_14283/g.34673 Transcript_14283/m.34673 type:complete len:255 (-) Transcript_14283:1630-2394(-)